MCQNAPPNTSSASQCQWIPVPTHKRKESRLLCLHPISINAVFIGGVSRRHTSCRTWMLAILISKRGCNRQYQNQPFCFHTVCFGTKESASYLTCKLLAPRKLFTLRRWRNLYGVSEHTHPLPSLDWNESWVWLKNQSAIKSHSHWWSSRNSCILHNTTQVKCILRNSTQLTKLVQLNTTLATYQNEPTTLGNRRPCWFLWLISYHNMSSISVILWSIICHYVTI